MAGTLKEIAEAARVSQMTVSRILNGNGKASPETLLRVRAAVEKYGYQPRSARRNRLSPEAGVAKTKITMLMPCPNFFEAEPLSSHHTMMVLEGALIAASESGAIVETQPVTIDNNNSHMEWQWFQNLNPGSLILAASTWYIKILSELDKRGCRIAMLHEDHFPNGIYQPITGNWLVLRSNIVNGLCQAIDYLVGRGYSRIAIGLENSLFYEPKNSVLKGYEQGMALQGNSYRNIIHWPKDVKLKEFLNRSHKKKPFDALIFHHTDKLAFDYSQTLAENLGLPKNMEIIATDDNIQYSFFRPKVYNIKYPTQQMSYDAAKMLLAKKYHPREIVYDTQFTV